MKRSFLFAVLLFIVTAGFIPMQNNTGIHPPAIVKKSFEKKFPGSTKLKWTKEAGYYAVNFVKNDHNMSALFDSKGTLKETGQEIKVAELPLAALQYIQQHYKTAKTITTAAIVKSGTLTTYEVGIKHIKLVFDATGKFIKEEKD